MCLPKAPPKPRMPVAPQAVTNADEGVIAAGDEERRRTAALQGSAGTDMTKGALKPAATTKKTALG